MALITYDDKVPLNENPDIADINKCNASDMNEIKEVVNENYNELKPYVLMNTNTPISINTEIPLNDDYTNYKYIDIYSSMWSSNYINHTRLDTAWGTLEIPMVNSTTSGGTEQMVAVGQFSANKLTITRLSGFSVSSSQVISNLTASPRIRKIVGYK